MEEEFTFGGSKQIFIALMTLCLPSFQWFSFVVFHFGGINTTIICGVFIFLFMAPNASLQVGYSTQLFYIIHVNRILRLTPVACCMFRPVTKYSPKSFIIAKIQVLIGQYAQTGLLGIWKALPLGRAVGFAWVIFISVHCYFMMIEMSRAMSFLIAVRGFFLCSKDPSSCHPTNSLSSWLSFQHY